MKWNNRESIWTRWRYVLQKFTGMFTHARTHARYKGRHSNVCRTVLARLLSYRLEAAPRQQSHCVILVEHCSAVSLPTHRLRRRPLSSSISNKWNLIFRLAFGLHDTVYYFNVFILNILLYIKELKEFL